ncbi:hypothetical protein GCM10027049_09780 [Mucilaginibacter puniceus]
MDTTYYLDKFKKSLSLINVSAFTEKNLELKVDIWLSSVVLKIQKKAWLNQSPKAKPFVESVFFSVWVNDDTLQKNRLYYNIHALKLRELKSFRIQSRGFAEEFRKQFKDHANKWPNVSTNYGPLTLMEGWVSLDDNLENNISNLANNFLDIAYIIDDLLNARKK